MLISNRDYDRCLRINSQATALITPYAAGTTGAFNTTIIKVATIRPAAAVNVT
jgi:hypothetical protein